MKQLVAEILLFFDLGWRSWFARRRSFEQLAPSGREPALPKYREPRNLTHRRKLSSPQLCSRCGAPLPQDIPGQMPHACRGK